MDKLVLMIVLCMVPAKGKDELRQAWKVEKQVPLWECLKMNETMSGAGSEGAIVVTCRGNIET